MPHSLDPEYAERAIPQYERAVTLAGGEPVRVRLDLSPEQISKIMQGCDGVLLPGSKADVDPARYQAARSPHTAASDAQRDAVDNLLLENAYQLRKPLLGICYGLQSLNVFRAGSLVQHIPDFLPEETRAKVNHEAGKNVAVAHEVEIDRASKLAKILCAYSNPESETLCGDSRPRLSSRAQLGGSATPVQKNAEQPDREGHGFSRATEPEDNDRASAPEGKLIVPVNSSHHQSADASKIGAGLRIVARCTDDGIIEALEGTAPDHFVLAVQWHPERSVEEDAASRAIFRAFIDAAGKRRGEPHGQAIP
jgi:putative glutamine amidotransferase